MRNQEWDAALAELDTLDLAELVLGLLGLDAVDGEAALGVVDQAEVLASLLERDDVHEAGRVGHIGADLAVNLDETLHHDGLGLAVVEGVLEAVAQEDDQREAFSLLVGSGRGLGGVDTRQLVEEPVRGGAQALLVLLTTVENTSALRRWGRIGITTAAGLAREGRRIESPSRGRTTVTARGVASREQSGGSI